VAVFLGSLVVGAGFGKPVRDLVMAKRLELVDELGRTRIVLSADYTQPGIVLKDELGENRLELTLDEEADPHVYLFDQFARSRVDIRQSESFGPALILKDASGGKRATFAAHPKGTGFVLFDRNGKMRLGAVVDDTVGPSMHMFDEGGKLLVRQPAGR